MSGRQHRELDPIPHLHKLVLSLNLREVPLLPSNKHHGNFLELLRLPCFCCKRLERFNDLDSIDLGDYLGKWRKREGQQQNTP
jgi:hypothetical protein